MVLAECSSGVAARLGDRLDLLDLVGEEVELLGEIVIGEDAQSLAVDLRWSLIWRSRVTWGFVMILPSAVSVWLSSSCICSRNA